MLDMLKGMKYPMILYLMNFKSSLTSPERWVFKFNPFNRFQILNLHNVCKIFHQYEFNGNRVAIILKVNEFREKPRKKIIVQKFIE